MLAAVPDSRRLTALSRLRHACARCGASCSSFRVGPLLPEDVESVRAAVPTVLGTWPEQRLKDPIAIQDYRGGRAPFLAKDGGYCVFFRSQVGCTIHARLGASAKPRVCRMFPLAIVDDGDALRLGVLPTCLCDSETWREGPVLPEEELLALAADPRLGARREAQEGEEVALEVLALPGLATAGLLAFLGQGKAPGGLDAWLDGRLAALDGEIDRLRAEDVDPGPLHPAAAVARVYDEFRGWHSRREQVGWPEVPEEGLPWLRDALRRLVFLRETRRFPTLPWALLAGLAAARWSAAWATAGGAFDRARFGRCFSAWLVLLEVPRLQRVLVEAGPPFPG